ncbi:MAG: FAD-binding oxidoreductase, partial [bacterium]
VVLPNGQDMMLGTRSIKDVAGYDLRHIFTGSRGSLAVITTAVFRVLPVTLLPSIEPIRNPPIYPIRSELKRLLDPNGRLQPAFNPPK